jgi:cell division cycle 2-like protein
MDYVGPSLDDDLARKVEEYNGHAFPEADVRGVKQQLLTGAAAMHERGIIHRDIKPTSKRFLFFSVDDGRSGTVV